MEQLQKLTRNVFFQGSIILTITNITISFLNYLSNSITAKALGRSGFGEFNSMIAYTNVLGFPLLIMTTVIIQKLGSVGKERNTFALKIEHWLLHKTLFSLRAIAMAAIIFVTFYLVGPPITHLQQSSVITLACLLLLSIFHGFYLGTLQGLQFFYMYSAVLVLGSIIRLIGSFSAYIGVGTIETIYVSLIIGHILVMYLAHMRMHKISERLTSKEVKYNKNFLDILKNPTIRLSIFSLLGLTLFSNMDIIVSKILLPAEQTGMYAAWSLFAKIIMYIIAPMTTLSLVIFSSTETKSYRKKVLYCMILGLIGISGIIMGMYVYFGKFLIKLILSEEFIDIYPHLYLAAYFGLLYTFITLSINYYLAHADKKALLIIYMMPMYVPALIFYTHSLQDIIHVNVVLGSIIAAGYVFSLFQYKMIQLLKLWQNHKNTSSVS